MEEKMIEGKDAKKSNWLPFLVVVIAAAVLIFASGGDDRKKTETNEEVPAGETSEGDAAMEGEEAGGSATAPAEVSGMERVVVASNFESWAPNGELREDLTVSRSLAVEGEVERAYLGVTASVEGRALNRFESVYVKINFDGGHLFRPASLETSGDESKTRLLYDLSDLAFLPGQPYDETRTPERGDLTALLIDGRHPLVTSFISTLEEGEIEELVIYYECAEGSDCSVALQE